MSSLGPIGPIGPIGVLLGARQESYPTWSGVLDPTA